MAFPKIPLILLFCFLFYTCKMSFRQPVISCLLISCLFTGHLFIAGLCNVWLIFIRKSLSD